MGDSKLERIIVTATRRAESVQDVPFNIQALRGETLEKVGALDQSDLIRLVPGLSASGEGALTTRLVLRGLRTAASEATSVTTSTYVDDTPVDLPARGSPLDLRLLDVERVEVLRGPQGTLYGGGAIGGTLRYISRKPVFGEREGRIGGGLESFDGGDLGYNAFGTVNVPLGEAVAVRGSIGYFNDAGYIDNVRLGADNVNGSHTVTGRLALRAAPTEQLDIDLTYYYQDENYKDRSLVASDLRHYQDDRYSRGYRDYLAQVGNLSINYDFGAVKFTSSTSYVKDEAEGGLDVTAIVRDVIYASFLPADLIPDFKFAVQDDSLDATQFTQELRLVSNLDGRFDWIAGAYFSKEKLGIFQQNRVSIPFSNQTRFENEVLGTVLNDDKRDMFEANRDTRNWAVFGELGFKLTPDWRASIGARHFDYKADQLMYSIDQFSPFGRDANGFARTTPEPLEYGHGSVHNDGEVYRFNTSYSLPRGLVYLTVAEGFRPGGFNFENAFVQLDPQQRQYDPDTLVSYEVGGKFSFLDNRVYLSSALFYIDWSDIQTDVYSEQAGFTVLGNAGKAKSQGFEIEVDSKDLFVDGLSILATYSFTDVKLRETVPFLGYAGQRAPAVPRHTGSLMLDYAVPVGAGYTLGFTGTTSYTGGSFTAFGPSRPDLDGNPMPLDQYMPLGDYWLTDLSARLEHDTWMVRAFVRNVGNTYAKLGYAYFLNTNNSPYRSSYTDRSVNPPRSIGIEFSKRL